MASSRTGSDHNLLICRNAITPIELRVICITDLNQSITRQPLGFAASWGSGDGTITFPIAFPVACRAVQATHLGPDNQFWSARDLSTTGFTVRTSSSANSGYWWLAIGR